MDRNAHRQGRNGAARPELTACGCIGGAALAQLDSFEQDVLKIARQFFETLARPESQAWMNAFRDAERAFPAPFGASIAHAVLVAINALRVSRKRTFEFERPESIAAPHTLTDCERYFILILHHIRRNNPTAARSHAMFLCEGNETLGVLAALERLAIITGDVTELRFNPAATTTGHHLAG